MLLAASPDGVTAAVMPAPAASTVEQMVDLVRAGLATATAGRVVARGRTIEVSGCGSRGPGGGRWSERSDEAEGSMTERTKQEVEARELMRQSRERRESGYASEADEKADAAFDAEWPEYRERWKEADRQRKEEDRRVLKFGLPIGVIGLLLLALPFFVSLPMQVALSAVLLMVSLLLAVDYAISRIRGGHQ